MAKYQFVAICPNDHIATQVGEREDLLRRVLANEKIRLFCASCEAGWNASPDFIESLRRSLSE